MGKNNIILENETTYQDPQAIFELENGDIFWMSFNYLTKNGFPYHQANMPKLNPNG